MDPYPGTARRSSVDDFLTSKGLVRQQGIAPITPVDDLAATEDPFESDAEYEKFLADLYASRRADIR